MTEGKDESTSPRGWPERVQEWQRDLRAGWRQMPDKPLLLTLLALWGLLFHFLGNATLGYTNTPSLFGWMHYSFNQAVDDRHCKYIPLVVLALFWWKRKELMAVPKAPWWPALGLVVLGLLLHVGGFLVQQTRVSIVGFFVGLYGLTGLVWGSAWLKASFFPYFLFAFCVPLATVQDTLTFPLRLIVTQISVGLAHGLGIDAVRLGAQIFDPTGKFQYEVAAACSGIRSLTALVALSTIYAFMTFEAGWKKLVILAASIPLAVAGNVARITTILVVTETFGQSAGMKIHDSWVGEFIFFAVGLVCVLLLGHWLRDPDPPILPSAQTAPVA